MFGLGSFEALPPAAAPPSAVVPAEPTAAFLRFAGNSRVRYIGVGEGMDDLQPFDPDAFIEAIFA